MTDREKLDRIFERTPNKHLLEWMRLKAMCDDKFRLSLLEEFWKSDKKDIRSVVEKCFMHESRIRDHKYDWYAVRDDILSLMEKTAKANKRKKFVEVAVTVRHLLPIACRAYSEDIYFPQSEVIGDIRRSVKAAMDLAKEILLEGKMLDEESRIGILKEMMADCMGLEENNLINIQYFMEEALLQTMPLQEYILYIDNLIDKDNASWRRDTRIILKAKSLISHGCQAQATDLLEKEIGLENVRAFYIECLKDWNDYERALELASDVRIISMWNHDWIAMRLQLLDFIGNPERTVAQCRKWFLEEEHKYAYYHKIKDLVNPAEWPGFIASLLDECDFKCDCDGAEGKIYVEENMLDLIPAYVERELWDIHTVLPAYVKYLTDEQHRDIARQYAQRLLDRSDREKNRRDYRHFAAELKSYSQITPVCRAEAKRLKSTLMERHCGRSAFMSELNAVTL